MKASTPNERTSWMTPHLVGDGIHVALGNHGVASRARGDGGDPAALHLGQHPTHHRRQTAQAQLGVCGGDAPGPVFRRRLQHEIDEMFEVRGSQLIALLPDDVHQRIHRP